MRFVANRIFRLWPLLLIAGAVCLSFGWLMMLPDDFENTANSIVATNFFANNILESITTKNYWDVNNDEEHNKVFDVYARDWLEQFRK